MTADMPQRMDSITSTITVPENEETAAEEQQQTQTATEVMVGQQQSDEQKEEDEPQQRLQEEEMTPRISNVPLITVAAADIVTTLSAVEESMSQVGIASDDLSSTELAPSVDPLAMDDTAASSIPPPPPPPLPDTRDVSSSRESLRAALDRRRNTLTTSELSFLEQLTIQGTDTEIELALQTLQDDDLFFDYSTPRHLKYAGGGGFSFEGDDTARQIDFSDSNVNGDGEIGLAASEVEQDATNITERTDLDNLDNVVVETRGSMGAMLHNSATSTEGDDDTRDGVASTVAGRENSSRSLKSSASSAKAVAGGNTNHKKGDAADPPVPASIPVMIGSKKRLEVLERRRSSVGINLGKIWKAHETGLAVTAAGSKLSLRRRQSIDGSVVSNLSANSGYSRHAQMEIFRRQEQADVFRNRNTPQKITIPKRTPIAKQMPPRPRRMPYHRSNSVTFGMISPQPKGITKPKIPAPTKIHQRRSSTGSRKSVTFHHIDEEFEFDDSHHFENDSDSNEEKKMPTSDLPKKSKMLRRSMSDSIRYDVEPLIEDEELKDGKLPTPQPSQTPSTSTLSSASPLERQDIVPSIGHAHPIRQDSMSSIPSLHHGHPIRQDSMSSIPSLHHGHPIRQDSMQSIPSLHHGHPVRQDSVQSIPSLHHGIPLRGSSVTSIPSLHHGVPLRESSVASIPSLHHGVPLRDDSVTSIPSLHHGHPLQSPDDLSEDLRRSRVRTFSAPQDIASAWLQQQPARVHDRTSSITSLGSLPHNVTVPLTETETSEREASMDDLSVLSPSNQDENDEPPPPAPKPLGGTLPPKPILMRLASKNVYEGEGIEVTELEDDPLEGRAPRNISILSMDASIRTVNSYDDMSVYSYSHRRTSDIFRTIRRSYSDESMSGMYLGSGRDLLMKLPDVNGNDTVGTTYGEDYSEASWDMQSEISGRFDAWNVLSDDYVNGYGGGGTLGFSILGTSASDDSAQPHVLSPPLMESLQAFMPYSKMGQNFFLKYSMVRDGASLPALLRRARGLQYTVLAVETVDGEVFGSFTSQPWRKNWNYFGTGESFLWKMRRSRLEKTHGILDQAQRESEIEVYPYTGENRFIQLCTHDRIAVGGGLPSSDAEKKMSEDVNDHQWGFGLAIQSDMLQGSSSPCLTFGSPSLSNAHSDGSFFEVINIELWTLTPCATVEEAEKLELGKLFLQKDPTEDMQYAY